VSIVAGYPSVACYDDSAEDVDYTPMLRDVGAEPSSLSVLPFLERSGWHQLI